jgi:RNA polymerase sigma-70 factor (ECF subfamily)
VSIVLGRTKLPYGQCSDEILIAWVVQGDSSALEALYDRYAPMILGIALRITGDRPLAEEVLQETFWQAWQLASTYSSEYGSFPGWLFRMTRRLAIEAGRKKSSGGDH